MEIGVVFPQPEIGPHPETGARFAQRAEALGYGHVLAYDHVLGANADRDGGWGGPYDHTDQFHEPFTLFSYLAGLTDDIEFVTGVLILPQRQTALVAKQAAQVDRFADGRFRLGVGVGWNPLEYVALSEEFGQRGRRIEEQVEVLRALWTENPTTYEGEFHQIPDMGIKPLPVQQPIPVWMGGTADVVLRRIGRVADGWIPMSGPMAEIRAQRDRIYASADAAGREADDIGIHGRFRIDAPDGAGLADRIETWEELGADYLSVHTMGAGRDPEEHIGAIGAFADELVAAGFALG